MAIEMSSDSAICYRCGMKYGKRKGYFSVSYSLNNKGLGYLPICKNCIEKMYNSYLSQCNSSMLAVRQMCRVLNLYWNEGLFNDAKNKAGTSTIIFRYLMKLNANKFVGKSYDDTLSDEGTLWNFRYTTKRTLSGGIEGDSEETEENGIPAPSAEVIAFWGSGYSDEMYAELEQRRQYWMSKLPDDVELDIGMEAIIRQICSLELDINRDRAAGKPVDKSINALNALLGSANWKPIQKKESADSAFTNPLGVWLYRYENEKPLPPVDKDLKDVNGYKKNVFTWMGHLCKMLGKKNGYTKLYEDEIEKLRVEKPEYVDEDDETLFADSLLDSGGDDT